MLFWPYCCTAGCRGLTKITYPIDSTHKSRHRCGRLLIFKLLLMKKILIPTDFSANAQHATLYALTLFGDTATYTLVNAYDVPHSGSSMLISIVDILKRDAEQLLNEELLRLQNEFPHLSNAISVQAEMGVTDIVLRTLVNKQGFDLVVMGTKGATGLKSILVGSVASNVLQSVSCAVLAVPATASTKVPETIVFAADDATLQLDHCPDVLRYIADCSKAMVMLLNVVVPPEKVVQSPSHRLPINTFDGVPHSYHFEEGEDIGEVIASFAVKHNAGMIAMVRRKKDLFANLFGKSKTKEMIQRAGLPLLVLSNETSI